MRSQTRKSSQVEKENGKQIFIDPVRSSHQKTERRKTEEDDYLDNLLERVDDDADENNKDGIEEKERTIKSMLRRPKICIRVNVAIESKAPLSLWTKISLFFSPPFLSLSFYSVVVVFFLFPICCCCCPLIFLSLASPRVCVLVAM